MDNRKSSVIPAPDCNVLAIDSVTISRTANYLRREGQERVARPSIVHPKLEDAVRIGDGEGGAIEPLSPAFKRDAFVSIKHHKLHLQTHTGIFNTLV